MLLITKRLYRPSRPFTSRKMAKILCKYSKKDIMSEEDMPPICRDCKYFVEDTYYSYESESVSSASKSAFKYEFGKCKYVYSVNIVSGEIIYPFATVMRVDGKNQCGFKGKFFEPKEADSKEEKNKKDLDETYDGAC
jgi:hypothetical protein